MISTNEASSLAKRSKIHKDDDKCKITSKNQDHFDNIIKCSSLKKCVSKVTKKADSSIC